jgi:hypothetical protein
MPRLLPNDDVLSGLPSGEPVPSPRPRELPPVLPGRGERVGPVRSGIPAAMWAPEGDRRGKSGAVSSKPPAGREGVLVGVAAEPPPLLLLTDAAKPPAAASATPATPPAMVDDGITASGESTG